MGAGIYVDTENLRDPDHAQNIVGQVIGNWPAEHPVIVGLSLYVRADKEALWRLWAEAEYPQFRVRVRGIQHFSTHRAKNSADLAITGDAVDDLITGKATFIAVASNDSDFGALFVKIGEIARDAGADATPFLWITAPDAGGISAEIEQFIPARFRWDLSDALAASSAAAPEPSPATPEPSPTPARTAPTRAAQATRPSPPPMTPATGNAEVPKDSIAEELIRRLPVGRFKVSDAHQVVQARWPRHPAAGDAAKMGQFLLNELWPILEKRGVTMPRRSSPRTYEITAAAKDSLAGSQSRATARVADKPAAPASEPTAASEPATASEPAAASEPTAPASEPAAASEPTAAQLAASAAAGIADDIFKSSDAQGAIRERWPGHPAASYTAAQFGVWFSKQLWPIMEENGVVLATERPRRYEITPDARHRLTSLA